MSFMKLETAPKGATYTCDCARCGATLYTHEWAHIDHNERRDTMQAGTLLCDVCCNGHANPDTFAQLHDHYACRYTAPGYLDCTDWEYGTDRRELERQVRSMYGE